MTHRTAYSRVSPFGRPGLLVTLAFLGMLSLHCSEERKFAEPDGGNGGMGATSGGDSNGSGGKGMGGSGQTCGGGEAACGDGCFDLKTDAAHCGVCGHSCLGGACAGGKCQPVTIVEGGGRLFTIQVDDNHVYYGGVSVGVTRVDKDGRNKLAIVEDAANEYAYFSTIGGGRFYWSDDWHNDALRWCATPQCDTVGTIDPEAAADPTDFISLTYEGTTVYYGNTAGEIYKTSSSSTAADIWVTGENAVVHLTSNDGVIYWGTSNGVNGADSAIRKKSTVGGAASNVVTGIDAPKALAVSKQRAYWAVAGGSIFSAPLPNGEGGPVLTAEPSYAPMDMIISNGFLYWTARANDVGSIERCPLADCLGNEETVADMQDWPWGIAADAERVWWVTETGTVNYVAQ